MRGCALSEITLLIPGATVSFLNQLKTQASALQQQRDSDLQQAQSLVAQTESACTLIWRYLEDLAQHLSVLIPPGPAFSLDGKTPWPAMQLSNFRSDARKRHGYGQEIFDHVGMGWQILPQPGAATRGSVSVNFPPDLERVESRLISSGVPYERWEVRKPGENALLSIRFDYQAMTRGSVSVKPNHEQGQLEFRLSNVSGFGISTQRWPATQIDDDLLDELAKLIIGQPSRFI